MHDCLQCLRTEIGSKARQRDVCAEIWVLANSRLPGKISKRDLNSSLSQAVNEIHYLLLAILPWYMIQEMHHTYSSSTQVLIQMLHVNMLSKELQSRHVEHTRTYLATLSGCRTSAARYLPDSPMVCAHVLFASNSFKASRTGRPSFSVVTASVWQKSVCKISGHQLILKSNDLDTVSTLVIRPHYKIEIDWAIKASQISERTSYWFSTLRSNCKGVLKFWPSFVKLHTEWRINPDGDPFLTGKSFKPKASVRIPRNSSLQ